MKLKYLKKLNPILSKVGKKHLIPVDEGEFILEILFKSIKDKLNDPRVPKVRIPLLGTFQPKVSFIDRSLKQSFRFHRLGGTTREFINARIKRIWGVRRRLQEENNNINTWFKWKSKEVKEEYKILEENELQKKRESKEIIYGGPNYPKKSSDILSKVLQ